jgi:hypothetical protein
MTNKDIKMWNESSRVESGDKRRGEKVKIQPNAKYLSKIAIEKLHVSSSLAFKLHIVQMNLN